MYTPSGAQVGHEHMFLGFFPMLSRIFTKSSYESCTRKKKNLLTASSINKMHCLVWELIKSNSFVFVCFWYCSLIFITLSIFYFIPSLHILQYYYFSSPQVCFLSTFAFGSSYFHLRVHSAIFFFFTFSIV